MNKKRLLAVVVAAVVFVALAVTGIFLLMKNNDKTATGAIYGTVGVNTVKKPENLEDLTFGISVTKAYDTGSGGLASLPVKNGETVTVPAEEEGREVDSITLQITRYRANSDYDPIQSLESPTVYEEEIPQTFEWNLTDVLSGVDWSDDSFDEYEVETSYTCTYSDSCLGQFYMSQVNLTYTDSDGYTYYYTYLPAICVTYK